MPRGLVASALHGVYTNPTFYAPLTNSLVLTRGVGNPTFTRSDTADYCATITDFEGLIKYVKSGEIRFNGARRVENLLSGTASLNSGSNKTITVVAGQYVFSMGKGASSGVATFSGTGGATGTLTQNASSRTATKFTLTAGTFIVTASVVTLVDLQLELISGQANQNPSEYVSGGILSSPYHGANVDGVKYFNYLNGNTLTNNVLTEAVGTAISDAILKGYLCEGNKVNLFKYSEQFNNGYWQTASNITITPDSVISPAGTLTADKFTELATTATHRVSANNNNGETIVSGTIYTLSCYFKKGTRQFHALLVTDYAGSHQIRQWFDLDNGILGTNSKLGTLIERNNATITDYGRGWYRATLTVTPTNTFSNIINLFITLASADGTSSYLGSITQYGYFWGAKLEAGEFASSYNPTVAGAVTRGLGLNRNTVSSNISNTIFTGYAEYTPTAATTSYIWGSYVDASNYTLLLYIAGSFIFRKRIAGTNYDATIAVTQTVGTKYKIAWRLSPIMGMDIFVNGTKGTVNANTTAMQLGAYFYIGNDGNGVESAWGYLKNYRNHKVAKTDTYLQAITT